jgi:integrase
MAYLMKDRHGTYYLRLVLTNELRQRLGIVDWKQKEFRRSLDTKSKREAARKFPDAYVKAISSFEAARQEASPPPAVRSYQPFLSSLLMKHSKHQELTGILPTTLNGRLHAIGLLIKYIGDKPVDEYEKQDARRFRDKLSETPKKGYPDEKIAVSTLNIYLSRVQAFFNWVEQEGFVTDNVFKGMKVQITRLQSSYRNIFSSEDLTKIFRNINTEDIRLDRLFVTYIAFYTACRISEACQLSKDDVYQVDGVWCIHIRETKPYQRLKNSYSERLIPVHSELIKLGILEHCATVEDRLFPKAKSAAISQWFRLLLSKLDIGSVIEANDASNKTFHSFRHTGVNILKQHGVDVSLTAALMGHSTGTMAYDRYGKTLKPGALVDIVELIKLEGEIK